MQILANLGVREDQDYVDKKLQENQSQQSKKFVNFHLFSNNVILFYSKMVWLAVKY